MAAGLVLVLTLVPKEAETICFVGFSVEFQADLHLRLNGVRSLLFILRTIPTSATAELRANSFPAKLEYSWKLTNSSRSSPWMVE
jgi:hypothetical protein